MGIKYITKEEYEEMTGQPYEESSSPLETEEETQFPESEEKGFLKSLVQSALTLPRLAYTQGSAIARTLGGYDQDIAMGPVKIPGILGGGIGQPTSTGSSFKGFLKEAKAGAGAGLEQASWLVGGGEAKAALNTGKILSSSVMRTTAKEGFVAGAKAYGRKAAKLSPISLLYESGKGLQGEQNLDDTLTNSFIGVLTTPAVAGILERGFKLGGHGLQKLAQFTSGEKASAAKSAFVDSADASKQNLESLYKIFRGKGFLNRLERYQKESPDYNFGHSIGDYTTKITADKGYTRTGEAVKAVNEDLAAFYGTTKKPGPYKEFIKTVKPKNPEAMPDDNSFLSEISRSVGTEESRVQPINRIEIETDVQKLWNEKFVPMLRDTFGYKSGKFNLEQLDAIRSQAGEIAYRERDEVTDQAAEVIRKTARRLLGEQAPELENALGVQESLIQTRKVLQMINGEKIGKSHMADLSERGIFYTLLRTGPLGWAVAAPAKFAAERVSESIAKGRLAALTSEEFAQKARGKLAAETEIAQSAATKELTQAASKATGLSEEEVMQMLKNSLEQIKQGANPSETDIGQLIKETVTTGAEKVSRETAASAELTNKFKASFTTLKELVKQGFDETTLPKIIEKEYGIAPESLMEKITSLMSHLKATGKNAEKNFIQFVDRELKPKPRTIKPESPTMEPPL